MSNFKYKWEVQGKKGIVVKVVADSISFTKNRLITFELTYPRIIHSELMTHRCLIGESELVFDLPTKGKGVARRFGMNIAEFCNKWNNGVAPHRSPRYKEKDLSSVNLDKIYTAKELSILSGISVSNIRTYCRKGGLVCQNPLKTRSEDYKILGVDFVDYRSNKMGVRTFSIRDRLSNMQIRMFNEQTGEVGHTTVTDCWEVGEKPVFTLKAGNFQITTTEDHLILTTKGWKELQHIKVGVDSVLYVAKGVEKRMNPTRLKKINGEWVSKWNKNTLHIKAAEQKDCCAHCGKKKKLEIHHVVPIHQDESLAFEVSNVVAVCSECHHNHYHKKQGWQAGQKLVSKPSVVDSITPAGTQLVYDISVASDSHNFVANNIIVHNCFSRNAMSSRAVPIKTLIDQVVHSPAQPIEFGKNKTGMSSDGELDAFVEGYTANEWWNLAGLSASRFANAFAEAGYHKQVANRLLEPFQFMKTVVTGTEFDNFFKLRLAADVDPTMKELASCMKEAYDSSTSELLKAGEWHTPYVEHFRESDGGATLEYIVDNISVTLEEAKAISASSCAQISYRNIDNSYDKAMKIYDRLGVGTEHFHASPFEHQGTPMDMMVVDSKGSSGRNELPPLTWQQGITHVDSSYCLWSGNFKGFIQYRQLL